MFMQHSITKYQYREREVFSRCMILHSLLDLFLVILKDFARYRIRLNLRYLTRLPLSNSESSW